MVMLFDLSIPWEVRTADASLHSCSNSRPPITPSQPHASTETPTGTNNGTATVTTATTATTTAGSRTKTLTQSRTRSSPTRNRIRTGAGAGSGSGSLLTLVLVALLIAFLGDLGVDAWPYVDCSGPNPILAPGRVTAFYDYANSSIGLELDGNFTNAYWAQGYTDAATSAWRTSIQTTLMGTQLYRSEGPACSPDGGIIVGGCPTAPGPGRIQTSFNISQSAPYAELMITLQIVGSNNQSIVCVSILLEQTMPKVNTALSYLPLALACLSGTLGLVATMMRAAVGNGLLGATATYGLASEAISVHTPGFFDIVFYTQFMVMTGQLSVNYPSFYPTFTALFHWSFLEFKDSLAGKGPANATYVLKYGGLGSVNQNQVRIGNTTVNNQGDFSAVNSSNSAINNVSQQKRDMDRLYRASREANLKAIADGLTLQGVYENTRHGSSFTGRQFQRRQEITASEATPTSPPSPTLSTDPPTSPTSTISTSTTDDTGPTPSSTRSVSRSKSTSARQPPPTRPPPTRASSVPVTSNLVIPTITDPFTNTSGTNLQYNVSRFGIESYAAAIGAFPLDLFLSTLINAALAAVGSLLVSGALLGFAWIMAKEKHQRGKTLEHALNFVVGNLLRVWSLLYTPLALSAMYQLTISGSVARTVVSAASLLIFSVGATIFFTWRILRASSELLLYNDQGTLLKYGTLYNTLAQEGTLFFLVTLLVRFLWGLSVAMLSSFGVAQVAILMVVEVGYLLVIAVKWPFAESGDNKFHLFLSVIRIAITGCSVAYLPQAQASPEVRELFAYIQMSLHLAVFIVIFALLLWNLIQVIMFWRMRHSDKWRGPTKTYNFEDPVEGTEPGWGLTGRPLSGGGTHTRGIHVAAHDGEDDEDGSVPARNRRFTVVSYSSLGSSSHETRVDSMQRALHAPPSPHQQRMSRVGGSPEEDSFLYGSPAERYRQARLLDNRRSRLGQSSVSEVGCAADDSIAERGLDTLVPLTAAAVAAVTAGAVSTSSKPPSQTPESEGETALEQSSTASGKGVGLPQRGSYANFQRMSQQQQDPRNRRMSDLTRDGPYLYQPAKTEPDSSAVPDTKPIPSGRGGVGLLAGVMASLGGVFKFGRRSGRGASSNGNGTKPKPFEVIRPPRRDLVQEPSSSSSFVARHADETGSQVGGDQLRELNSLGISRFFQESDRGYESNRNLFVANPTAMISRNGSLISTAESQRQQAPFATSNLIRQGSGGTLASVQTLGHTRSKGVGPSGLGPGTTVSGAGVGASLSYLPGAGSLYGTGTSITGSVTGSIAGDRASLMAGLAGLDSSSHSDHGGNTSNSDRESRRASSARMSASGTGGQMYPPRHSVESSNNIAEALKTESPLLLQGGGTLKVFKGPEKKAVQYFHDSATEQEGSAAEAAAAEAAAATAAATASIAAPSMPPLLLPRLETSQITQRKQQQQQPQPRVVSTASSGSLLVSSPSTPSTKDQARTKGGVSGQDSSSTTSPTDSQPSSSTNIAASAGRMQEILGRIFPDSSIRHDGDMDDEGEEGDDSESVLSRGTVSTFSSRGQRAKVGHVGDDEDGALDLLHVDDFDDSISVEKYDMLVPVLEGDSDEDVDSGILRMPSHPPQKLQLHPYQQQQRLQEDYLTSGGSAGAFDPDRTPRQSMFDTRLTSNMSTPSTSVAAVNSLGVQRTPSVLSSPSTPERRLMPGSSMARTHSGASSSANSSSSRPNSPAGASLHRQSGIHKVRSKSSFSSRPLAQTPLHSPSFQFANAGSLAPGSNSGSGSGPGSIGSGQGSSVSSLPHMAAAGHPANALLGSEYLSRQSSIQSATSSRTDYQDAPSYFSDPYHSNNSSNSNYHNSLPVQNQSLLNRNASIATVMTNRTDDSFVTAFSQEHSDDDEEEEARHGV